MDKPTFYILGFDASGQATGPVGKKAWDDKDAAENHAMEVLKSQINSPRFVVVEVRSIIQRCNPPIEVVQLDFTSPKVRNAA